MATSVLPGLVKLDPANYAITFAPPTYTALVTQTLGNAGLPGDAIEQGIASLQTEHDNYFVDVDAQIAAFPLPDPSGPPLDLTGLILLEAEVAVQSSTELAIGSAFDFLAATFGVWGIFDTLVQEIKNALYDLANWVLGQLFAINNLLNFINPGTFGPL